MFKDAFFAAPDKFVLLAILWTCFAVTTACFDASNNDNSGKANALIEETQKDKEDAAAAEEKSRGIAKEAEEVTPIKIDTSKIANFSKAFNFVVDAKAKKSTKFNPLSKSDFTWHKHSTLQDKHRQAMQLYFYQYKNAAAYEAAIEKILKGLGTDHEKKRILKQGENVKKIKASPAYYLLGKNNHTITAFHHACGNQKRNWPQIKTAIQKQFMPSNGQCEILEINCGGPLNWKRCGE